MFTGLIEAVCTVRSVRKTSESLQLDIDMASIACDVKIGDSIAVNGVCLTAVSLNGKVSTFDASGETIEKSTISKIKPQEKVNIERSLKPSDRLGGHFVQGHVDATATIKEIKDQGDFCNITFCIPDSVSRNISGLLVPKGSVAVNGISLTIASVSGNDFTAALIPQTIKSTTLSAAKTGDSVNIETDIIARTIKCQLEQMVSGQGSLTIEKLKEMGF